MPRTAVLHQNWTAGELSPKSFGRTDLERYARGALSLENWYVNLEGSLTKRPGTRDIAEAGVPTLAVRLVPFIFRSVDALVLEFGDQYIRFYKNGAQILSGGLPYEVATPYAAADLFALWFTPKNDVVYIWHRSYAPRKLERLADDNWVLADVHMSPPPTHESGLSPAVTLTLSALTGTGITATASGPAFLAADEDREITSGVGLAVIASVTSSTQVTLDILDDFTALVLASGAWTIEGSPVAQLKADKMGPIGGTVTLRLRKIQASATNLVTNGEFASGLANWTNLSGPTLVTGTHTGSADANQLEDSTKNFAQLGVISGMRVVNSTDNNTSTVNVVGVSTCTLTGISGGSENDFDVADVYEIHKSGSAVVGAGGVILNGGAAGAGEISQSLVTVADTEYRLTFDVGGGAMGAYVGTTQDDMGLAVENAYPPGKNNEVIFLADDTSSFIHFRNNQPVDSILQHVRARIYSIDGWRAADVGAYVYVHDGLVKITQFINARKVKGHIITPLATDEEAAAGAWTLERAAWSATNGYPGLAVFHEQRLIPMSSLEFPQTLWGSRTDDFENYARTNAADGGFVYTIADAEGLIQWAVSAKRLIIGAENAEFQVGEAPLSATDPPSVSPIGENGSSMVEPIRIGSVLVFCTIEGAAVAELSFDQNQETYDADDLTLLSGHLLTDAHIVQLAYVKRPVPAILAVRSDGTLLWLTYKRKERIFAWSRFVMASGGLVRSVCVIPHPTDNAWQVWLCIAWDGVQRIAILDSAAQGVDAAVVGSGAPTTTLTGLAHLNGQAVRIAGIPETGTHMAVFPDDTVSAGAVTVPLPVTAWYAGLGWDCPGETLSPEIQGAASIQGELKRWNPLLVRVYNTGEGLVVNDEPIVLRTADDLMDDGVPLKTGTYQVTSVGWEESGTIRFTHTTPLPATVLLLGGHLESGAR